MSTVKTVTVIHRSMSGHEPSYLVDDWQLVADCHVRKLPSADTRTMSSTTEHLMHASAPHCESETVCQAFT